MADGCVIRPCRAADATRLAAIYNHYIRESVATFEEEEIPAADMARRIAGVTVNLPWLVAEADGVIAGYAYATAWKSRSAYRHSVESTIYLAPEYPGRGIGTLLYRALLDELRGLDVHCIIGGISLPNPSSIALHEKLGFTHIGSFREVGWKQGRWVDVGYWELIL